MKGLRNHRSSNDKERLTGIKEFYYSTYILNLWLKLVSLITAVCHNNLFRVCDCKHKTYFFMTYY